MTVRVDYDAVAACPSRAEFLESVRRYTTKWSLVDDDATQRFAILLERSGAGVRGSLDITTGERRSQKVVSGPSCATVTRAFAVMVALVIDPTASVSGAGRQEEAPPVPPTTPTGEDEPPVAEEEEPADGSDEPEQRPTARKKRPSTKARRKAVHAVATSPRWMFEVRSEASSAITKRSMALVAAFVDLQVPIFARRNERTAVIGPSSIGIGLRQSMPRTIGVPGGSTEFLWSAASLRVCPLRLRLFEDRLDIAPCVDGNVGMLAAESHGLPFAQQTRRHWLDGGASVLGVWHLPGPWVATAGLGMVVPLTRHRFEVVDLASLGAASGPRSELVSQAPRLGISAGIGLGLEL